MKKCHSVLGSFLVVYGYKQFMRIVWAFLEGCRRGLLHNSRPFAVILSLKKNNFTNKYQVKERAI